MQSKMFFLTSNIIFFFLHCLSILCFTLRLKAFVNKAEHYNSCAIIKSIGYIIEGHIITCLLNDCPAVFSLSWKVLATIS